MRLWLEKQRHLIDFTLASLARRKAKNLGLWLVYTLLVFVLASLMLFTQALRTEAGYVLAGSPEVILQRMVAGRHDLIPPGYLDTIGRIRGVQKKEGRLWGYYFDPVLNANYTFMARPAEEIPDGHIMVGNTLARERGLAPHNTISFRSYSGKLFSFEVAATLSPDSELLAADFDERDPAVKKVLERAIEACLKQGKYVGICGQGPSDHPDFAKWLADKGIVSISLNPDTVIDTWQNLAG